MRTVLLLSSTRRQVSPFFLFCGCDLGRFFSSADLVVDDDDDDDFGTLRVSDSLRHSSFKARADPNPTARQPKRWAEATAAHRSTSTPSSNNLLLFFFFFLSVPF